MINWTVEDFVNHLLKNKIIDDVRDYVNFNITQTDFNDELNRRDLNWSIISNENDYDDIDGLGYTIYHYQIEDEKYKVWVDENGNVIDAALEPPIESSRQITSAKSEEEFEDVIIQIEDMLGVNAEHGNIFNLNSEIDEDTEYKIDDICRQYNCKFVPVNGSRRQYRLIQSSRRIQSMKTPKNVYLNEDTQKLIQRLEKRVGHELKLKFEEGNTPYVEIEKLPKGGYSFITPKYLNNLAEHFLYDGYKEKQDSFIVYLDPAIMYTRPGIKSSRQIKSELNHFYDPATDYIDEELTDDEEYKYSQFKVETGYYLTPQRTRIDVYTVYSPNGKYLGQTSNPNKILDLIRGKRVNSSRRNGMIKSAYTREDYDRFDEVGNFIPYQPTEEELAKKDEIKKVLKQELSDAYEPDPMDDYVGYDSTNERIDMACEWVAKQFGVDTDFVEDIAGEIDRENIARAQAEPEYVYQHCKNKDRFWDWYNGEDVSLEELGIDKEQMDKEVDEIVHKYVNSSRQIKSDKQFRLIDTEHNDPKDGEDFTAEELRDYISKNDKYFDNVGLDYTIVDLNTGEEMNMSTFRLNSSRQIKSSLNDVWKEGYNKYVPEFGCDDINPYTPGSIEWSVFMEGWYASRNDKGSSKQIKSALDTVKVTFDNGDTIVTDYNADVGREEIAKYYMHHYFNVGNEDEMHQVVKVEFPGNINSARTPEVADMQDAEDLALFAENDVELYNTVIKPTFDSLQRKLKRGIYDKNKALIAWEHVIDEAAKAYDRQLGSKRGTMTMFNKATRKEAAKILMDSIWDEDEWQA